MNLIDLIGYLAACLTTAAFVPQALLTWRSRRADGVSTTMYLVLLSGVLLWLYYGVLISSLPIIIANTITFVLASFILVMKLAYRPDSVPQPTTSLNGVKNE